MPFRIPYAVPLLALALLLILQVVTNAQDPAYVILRRPEPAPPVTMPEPARRRGYLPACDSIRGLSRRNPTALQPIPTAGALPAPQGRSHIESGVIVYSDTVPVMSSSAQGRAKEGYGEYPIYRTYRQPYAYGWFGASPNANRSTSHGYHRHRTQWSFQ